MSATEELQNISIQRAKHITLPLKHKKPSLVKACPFTKS